ncbi:MAG: thioredoxin family protein [Candidatus Bathyarchaeota archaeon]|jgi:thiol-disulfide isomerase/thioredoxin|nr:thioredoxin family protein [Candidatus Bathyarchaeota archaeon]
MAEKPAYYDVRAELWRRNWETAKPLSSFLEGAPQDQVQRWLESEDRAPVLTDEQKARLRGYNRTIRILMEGAPWCLDCARVAPYLKEIVEAIGEKAELRLINRDTSPELRDELKIMGAPRIPRVVVLSEDWFEVDRLGDRSLSVYRSRMAREIGRGVNLGILRPAARQAEYCEWIDAIERALIILRTAPALRKRYND